MNNDQPATKQDLIDAIKDLRHFIIEREVVSLRWIIGIQIAYFFGTLAAVWFMVSHYKP